MKTTATIEGKTFEFASNALTPILYRQLFRKDFLRELTSYKKLQGKKPSEFTEEEEKIYEDHSDAFSRMAFVMNKQAELETADRLMALTMADYYNWLTGFNNPMAFSEADALSAVLRAWTGNAEDMSVEAKNAESRETEK